MRTPPSPLLETRSVRSYGNGQSCELWRAPVMFRCLGPYDHGVARVRSFEPAHGSVIFCVKFWDRRISEGTPAGMTCYYTKLVHFSLAEWKYRYYHSSESIFFGTCTGVEPHSAPDHSGNGPWYEILRK